MSVARDELPCYDSSKMAHKKSKPKTFTAYQKSSVTRGHNFWQGELQMLAQIAADPEWDTSKSGVLRELIRQEHHRLGLDWPNDDDPI